MADSTGTGYRYAVGEAVPGKFGDITLASAIDGQSASAIERRLGFHKGRLSQGYCVLVLTETVNRTDFIWGDQTRYSGGRQVYRDENAYVPRRDLLRGELLVRLGSDAAADAALRQFFDTAATKINAGVAKRSVIKVVPNIQHNDDMNQHLQYPDAAVGNIPQWTLVTGKAMQCIAQVAARDVYTHA